jgi:hypothetical protein
MSDIGSFLTSRDFSQKTGIPVSTITKMLRDGTIKGEKRGGKWAIDESQIHNDVVRAKMDGDRLSADPVPPAAAPASLETTYDVETFASLTYLTENGVRTWYRTGRLEGFIDGEGLIRINAANLEKPELRHLRR